MSITTTNGGGGPNLRPSRLSPEALDKLRKNVPDWNQIMEVEMNRVIDETVAFRLKTHGIKVEAEQTTENKRRLHLLDIDAILNYEPDPKEEIWAGSILMASRPTALIGAPGAGKSRLSLQAAIYTIMGRHFLDWETKGEGLKWLFLQTENSTRRLKSDLGAMTRHLPKSQMDKIRECLRIQDIMAMDFATICMVSGHPDRPMILEAIDEWAPDIVVIDPLRDAGQGDPNKDADMTETCSSIGAVVRQSNPRRVPLVIHHGRTGAAEAAKVFGDDAASFARNSKVLHGWLRSQINVAQAGVDYPDIVIVGCGKCSDGPKWQPFAAKMDPHTMLYRRLEEHEFDLEEWAEQMGAASKKKRKLPTPVEIAEVISAKGGKMCGGEKNEEGLIQTLQRQFNLTRELAKLSAETALGSTIFEHEEPRPGGNGSGKKVRVYTLTPAKTYVPKPK